MAKVLNQVQDLEHEGYEFEAAGSIFRPAGEEGGRLYRPKFERWPIASNIEADPRGQPITEATVKVRIGERTMHTVSEGDGPVNALDGALRKALEACYPRLAEMTLVDYKVRVVNSRAGTAARVRVVIESARSRRRLGHRPASARTSSKQAGGAGRFVRVQAVQG